MHLRRSSRISAKNVKEVISLPLQKKRKGSEEVIKKEQNAIKEESENIIDTADLKSDAIADTKIHTKSKKKNIGKNENDFPLLPPSKYESFITGPPSVLSTGKKYVGCHVSAADGIWNAFINGRNDGAQSIGLFLRNQRTWNSKPLEENVIQKWKEECQGFPSHLILPHGSYLMNLGSPKAEVLEKSRNVFLDELQRCERLGISNYNFHPGSTLGQITREECCKLVAESINMAHEKTKDVICVIENMSKQGFTVGGDFNEIRLIIENVKDKTRVGVCLDTCHSHAAGYDLSSKEGFEKFLDDFERIIGWQFLRALHINDSKGGCGDHKDRHENIGKGTIGIEGFKRIMNCPYFDDIPLILETPFTSPTIYAKEIKKLQQLISKK